MGSIPSQNRHFLLSYGAVSVWFSTIESILITLINSKFNAKAAAPWIDPQSFIVQANDNKVSFFFSANIIYNFRYITLLRFHIH